MLRNLRRLILTLGIEQPSPPAAIPERRAEYSLIMDHKGRGLLLLFLLLSGVLGKKLGLNVTRNRLIVSECHRERRRA